MNEFGSNNSDLQEEKEEKFSKIGEIALGTYISLLYEGSKDIDYEKFLIERVISLGDLNEKEVQELNNSSNKPFRDSGGNEYSAKLAYFVDAFWKKLDITEREILENELGDKKGPLLLEPLLGLSEELFESEEGVNSFLSIMRKDFDKMLLVSLLTNREFGLGIYKNPEGKYLINRFPQCGKFGAIPNVKNEGLENIFFIHTHPVLTDFDRVEKRFVGADGFSYNPDDEEDERSDWLGFLSHIYSRAKVESVLSSNGHLSLIVFKDMDIDEVVKRAKEERKGLYTEDLAMLDEEGVITDVVSKNVLKVLTDNSNFVGIDKKLTHIFGYDLYEGSVDLVRKV